MREHLCALLKSSAVWGTVLTVAAFGLGTWVRRRTGRTWCNPLLLASLFLIAALTVLQVPYGDYKASAGPVSWLLLPATVSLAIPLWEKWTLLRENAVAILAGVLAGVLTSLGSILVLAWFMDLELAPGLCRIKSITAPVAQGGALGTASHALGTVRALEMGETEGAMSGLAIAVAGVLTAALAPVCAGLLP